MRHDLDKEHLLKLTLAVYKVTAIFPVGEELGLKIRESADSILADLLLNKINEKCSRYIEGILGFFDMAEKKNWVDKRNFLVLRGEYENIRQICALPQSAQSVVHSAGVHRDRQDKILAVMAGNGAVKIGDLIKLFPGVNRRTVLRDLDTLCQTGVMVRNGSGRGAFYIKNGHGNGSSTSP